MRGTAAEPNRGLPERCPLALVALTVAQIQRARAPTPTPWAA